MNIITNKPIIFSNAEGDKTPKEKKTMNPDTLKVGADVLTGIGSTLAGKQRSYTDAEQRCGKKPLSKKARVEWQKCVDAGGNVNTQPTTAPTDTQPTSDTKQPMSKNTKIGLIAGGVVVLAIIGFVIYKSTKK
jgi:hypothetical protein